MRHIVADFIKGFQPLHVEMKCRRGKLDFSPIAAVEDQLHLLRKRLFGERFCKLPRPLFHYRVICGVL